jgi:hypothetical protein
MVITAQAPPDKVRTNSPKQKKVTCRTCGLTRCTGQCRWETAAPAKPPAKIR